ncbi:MAG: RDD family protein [Verrucomicrobiales bacterium]|nr:RDD family protein [Verrucomicrobiales bacterium]
MDFYLSIDGQKEGPISQFRVGDWIDSGKVTESTLGWHRDLDAWKPLGEIPALSPFFEKQAKEAELPEPPPLPAEALKPAAEVIVEPSNFDSDGKRPFARLFARLFDYTMIAVIVFLSSDVEFPQPAPGESFSDLFARYMEQMQQPEAVILARTQFIALVVWQLFEGVLIHMLGTTPGKALFGIRVVQDDGKNISIGRSIGRSFYVYVLGAGFYQFPFILIGGIFSIFRLNGTGKCLWDQHLETKVMTKSLSAGRIMLAIAAFFVLVMLQSVKFS